jgi:hypothetical protein
MDLSKFNVKQMAEKGADLELLDPEGEPLLQDKKPVTIKLLGTDSTTWRNLNRDRSRALSIKMQKKRSKQIDFTMSDEDSCEMLAACTLGWAGIDENKKPLEFSKEAAYEMYINHLWIREQVDAFIGDRANFFTTALSKPSTI